MLWRKLFRDLQENKGAYFACIVIIMLGLMVYSSFSIVMNNLNAAQQNFYDRQNFADGFAEVKGIPLSEVAKLQTLAGIKEVQGRLIKDVRVLNIGQQGERGKTRPEEVYLRFISTDPANPSPINAVFLEKGKPLQKGQDHIWVDSKFFAANKLQLNDPLAIVANGQKKTLQVVGTGSSPEFVYIMRNSSEIFPHPETFGIAYLPFESMKTLFAEGTLVNSLVFTLQPGATYQEAEDQLKPLLKPYGLKSIYPRKDQASHSLLTQELTQLQAMSKSMPAIFLAVACMILYIMLKRTVEKQRGQIGILKAFGYTRGEIISHYLAFALLIGFSGGLLGGILGSLLASPLTTLYETFFNIPGLQSRFSFSYLYLSVLLALLFALFAGYQGCKSVLSLEPAEAMRPLAPPSGKNIWLEKIALFWQALTVQGKMSLRSMMRHPGRTAFLFLGVMFCFALLGSPWSLMELSETMLFEQYEKVELYDAKINLVQPLPQQEAEQELRRFPGMQRVEGRAEVPVTLKNNWQKKEVVLLGLPQDSQLYQILDQSGKRITPSANGILLSERLAQLLDAQVGTRLKLESLMAKNPDAEKTVVVTGIIPQYLGLNAYMDLEALQNLLQQKKMITALMLRLEADSFADLKEHYQNSAAIESIENKNEALRQSKEMMASYSGTIYIFLVIGLIIGFAIIYNISATTVSERSRELASMMVLGMTPQEVLSVITFEQWFISIFAMFSGIPLTKLFLVGMNQSLNSDLFSLPTTVSNTSMIASFLATVFCIRIAQLAAARKIKKLSLVEVLKASE